MALHCASTLDASLHHCITVHPGIVLHLWFRAASLCIHHCRISMDHGGIQRLTPRRSCVHMTAHDWQACGSPSSHRCYMQRLAVVRLDLVEPNTRSRPHHQRIPRAHELNASRTEDVVGRRTCCGPVRTVARWRCAQPAELLKPMRPEASSHRGARRARRCLKDVWMSMHRINDMIHVKADDSETIPFKPGNYICISHFVISHPDPTLK